MNTGGSTHLPLLTRPGYRPAPLSPPRPSGSATLRLRVLLTRSRLDRQLAEGRLTDSTAALELRAGQLESPCECRALAGDLRRIVGYADRNDSRSVLSAVAIHTPAVASGRRELLALAERLQDAEDVSPRAIALTRVLITDVASPLFDVAARGSVVQAVWRIEDALALGGLRALAG